MHKRTIIIFATLILLFTGMSRAQITPWFYWTLLPEDQMDKIAGEASGETAWHTIMETGGYSKNRPAEEWAGTFFEAQFIYDQLILYGLPGAEIVRFPGGETWNGIKGELWEIKPILQKLASYRDHRAMLASGSTNTDVKAELAWVGRGTKKEIESAQVEGKIVVTEGRISSVHDEACLKQGALGVLQLAHHGPISTPFKCLGAG
jgi:hypothetical protein